MDKIRDLLIKAGCKQELVTQICESLEEYRTTVRGQYEADYTAKLEQAKKICLEETEAHKRELARRLQVFCETKSAAIEAHIARQTALREAEAVTRLSSIKSLLDGIESGGRTVDGSTAATLEKARRQIRRLMDERNKAIETANRQTQIAEKVLRRNRQLITENARLKHISGDRTIVEGRKSRRPQRIDMNRHGGQPQTTRPTIVENQDRRRPASTNGRTHVHDGRNGRPFGIDDIAAQIDEDLI